MTKKNKKTESNKKGKDNKEEKFNKILLIPYIFSLTYIFLLYNNNFFINGAYYEFLFREIIIVFIINSILQFSIYILFNKIIHYKLLLIILQILLIFALKYDFLIFVFLLFLFFSIIFRKDYLKVNSFFDGISVFLFIFVFFISSITVGRFAYNIISFSSRLYYYDKDNNIRVTNKNKDNPNIYWMHVDGMPNTDFIKKYYKNKDLNEYLKFLEDNKFINNTDASFKAGHHTMTSLAALYNPQYYDDFLNKYYSDLDRCSLNNCLSKNTISFKELTYKRLDNELMKGLKKNNYTTVSVTEFNQYTSFDTDYIYDIANVYDDKKIKYIKNNYTIDEIYKKTVRVHEKVLLDNFYKGIISFNEIKGKEIDYNIDLKEYEYLDKTDFIPMKAFIKSIDDALKKDNNSKFFFLDNGIIHLRWNYDSKGEKLGDWIVDLDNFDDNYIYTTKLLMDFVKYIKDNDPNSIIIIQADHGIHTLDDKIMMDYYKVDEKELLDIRNSTVSSIYVPEKYLNGDEKYLDNPLNISRYLINNFVGDNYKYIKK